MSSSLALSSTRVLVLAEDGVVGRALELLLRSADYGVRFLPASSLDELGTLDGVGLVLLCPGLSAKHLELLLALVGRASTVTTKKTEVPILELIERPKGTRAGSRHFLSWPCRAEDLKRRINAILSAETGLDGDGNATRRSDEKGEGE